MEIAPSAPEVPTDEDWRALMKSARKARGYTQKTLAAAIGVKQPTISEIESGEVGGSKYVLAICDVLKIRPPMMCGDQLERRWIEGGRALRSRRSNAWLRMLEMIEDLLRDAPDPDAHPTTPEKRPRH